MPASRGSTWEAGDRLRRRPARRARWRTGSRLRSRAKHTAISVGRLDSRERGGDVHFGGVRELRDAFDRQGLAGHKKQRFDGYAQALYLGVLLAIVAGGRFTLGHQKFFGRAHVRNVKMRISSKSSGWS